MTKPAEEIIHQCFDTLASQVPGLEIFGETLEERFSALQSASRDDFVYELVSTRLNLDGRYYRAVLLRQSPENFQGKWREYSLLYIFTLLAKGSINESHSCVSLQHWIPVCYTRNFSERVSSKRICHLDRYSAGEEGIKKERITDKIFLHRPGNNGGKRFYDDRVEFFLSQVESMYSTATRQVRARRYDSSLQLVIAYLFMEILELRKPDEDGNFTFRTFNDLVRAVCERLDEVESPHLTSGFPDRELGFTADRRIRPFKTKDGVLARVYPVSPNLAFIVSDSAITDDEADRLASRYGRVTRSRISSGEPLYGSQADIQT